LRSLLLKRRGDSRRYVLDLAVSWAAVSAALRPAMAGSE